MAIKTMTPSPAQINELRQRFLDKYQDGQAGEQFHPIDVDRVVNDDLWCKRFLEMYDLDMTVSFAKLWDTCIWRQNYGANDLNESNLCLEYLKDGVVFPHNCDLDGKPLLIFKTKLHTKGAKDMDEVIRVVVYWIERIHRETHMEKITIFFDMAGTGLASMDLDFIKRIIETFKLYYPNALNMILVFEMAWVLNAGFKIIKGLLPPKAVEILKMISKKDINTYIDTDNCLSCWGGNDHYEFAFVPEQTRDAGKRPTPVLKENGSATESTTITTDGHDKKVTAGGRSRGDQTVHKIRIRKPEPHIDVLKMPRVHFANIGPRVTSTIRKIAVDSDSDTGSGKEVVSDMLRLSPNKHLFFSRGDGNDVSVYLHSTSKFPITYKIQTTSPEKFRVKPYCGIIKQNNQVTVNILLKPDHQISDQAKDKFLIMCMLMPPDLGDDMSTQQLNELWKQAPSEVEQHRLCCVYKDAGDGLGMVPAVGEDLKTNLNDISKHAQQLEKQLRYTQLLQCATIVFLILLSAAVVYLLRQQTLHGSSSCSAQSDRPEMLRAGSVKTRHQ